MMEFHLDDLLNDVIALNERDYMYGRGTLRLRLLSVTLSRADPGWAKVVGLFIDFRGDEHGVREALVRVEALTAHLRSVGAGVRGAISE